MGFKKILQLFSEIVKQDKKIFFDMLVWSKYLGGQGPKTGGMKRICRAAARTECHLVICWTLMLSCAKGLKLASEVVFHIPTEFDIKALIVLLILYSPKHSVIHFLCTTGVLTDSHLCSVYGFTHMYIQLIISNWSQRFLVSSAAVPLFLWSAYGLCII